MGTVADKLTYLNTTKSNLKDSINNLGGDIDNNTTFRNYATELDNIYDKLPKVSDTGTSISLTSTLKGRLGSELKGDTKQKILPDEYTQVEYIESSGTQYIDTGIFPTTNIQVETKIEVRSTGQDKPVFGCYIPSSLSSSLGGYYHLTPYNNMWYWGGNNSEGNGGVYTPVIGTKYTIVFNDSNNKIRINDDVFTPSMQLVGFNNSTLAIARRGSNANYRMGIFKYYYFKVYDKTTNTYLRDFIPCYRNSDNEVGLYDLVNGVFYTNQGTGTFDYGSIAPTPEAPIDINNVTGTQNVVVSDNNNNSQEVEIDLGDIELCKIGNYQDYIRKSTGKNKAKFTNCNVSGVGYSLTINNNEINVTTQETNNNFDLTGGLRTGNWEQSFSNATDYNLTPADLGTYTCKMFVEQLSGSGSANSNLLVITNQRVINTYFKPTTTSEIKTTFTLNGDEHIKQIAMWTNGTTSINLKCKVQLEKSSTATEYEPYGKVWYLHKEIKKLILDGSENWYYASGTRERFSTSISDIELQPYNSTAPLVVISNYFSGTNWYNLYNNTNIDNALSSHDSLHQINVRSKQFLGSTNDFKNWLSNNNATIYYVLSTPTNTEITDSNLLNQLEQLYNLKSYDDTTNIDTLGNLPVVITASAIKGV